MTLSPVLAHVLVALVPSFIFFFFYFQFEHLSLLIKIDVSWCRVHVNTMYLAQPMASTSVI